MIDQLENRFTKYEIARILGARSLQLAMDAPVLLKISKEEEEELNFDTLKIAEKELIAEVLPITVKRPLPKKSEKLIKKLSDKEIQEKLEKQKEEELKKIEKNKEEIEEKDETEIKQEGEIMEMATPEDEVEQESTEDREEA